MGDKWRSSGKSVKRNWGTEMVKREGKKWEKNMKEVTMKECGKGKRKDQRTCFYLCFNIIFSFRVLPSKYLVVVRLEVI